MCMWEGCSAAKCELSVVTVSLSAEWRADYTEGEEHLQIFTLSGPIGIHKNNGFVGSGSVAFMKYQWPQETVLDIKAKDFHSCKRTHLFPPLAHSGIHLNSKDSVTSLFHLILLSEAYEGWDHMIQTNSCRTFNKDWKVNTDDSLKKYHGEGIVHGLLNEKIYILI